MVKKTIQNKKIKNSYSDTLRINAVSEQVKTVSEVRNLILKCYIKISVPVPGVRPPRLKLPGHEANHLPQYI